MSASGTTMSDEQTYGITKAAAARLAHRVATSSSVRFGGA